MKGRSPKRPEPTSASANPRLKVILFATVIVMGTCLAWAFAHFALDKKFKKDANQPQAKEGESCPPAEHPIFDLPKITPARFRNATQAVGYVGSGACLACHREEHESYLHTTHSRSMGEVDAAREPPSGEFAHELSGRNYRVYREGESLRLREFIKDADREVVLADHAARYVLGSGNYARMYLAQVEDYLIEAPMTWYPRQDRWEMSAGYGKNPHQEGFNREIDANCLRCHAGRVENVGSGSLRLKVEEMAIGCERCHGPGELHIKERQAKLPIQGKIDDSIVNLRHLSREQQEDVCSQCHLSSSADVNVRGRARHDFRPGLRMADFVIPFRVDRPDSAMTVSGQIEQMRLSRCYSESKSMTCTTCHDPHAEVEQSARVQHFRAKCLNCHEKKPCREEIQIRQEKQQDNCIACHMPRGPTDIPHFSFTHHRIGLHAEKAKTTKLTEADKLVSVVDVSHLPEWERQRTLGLANDIFAGKLATGLDDETRDDPSYRALASVFSNRARQILEEVRSQGLRDPEVEMLFSRLNWRKNPAQCIEYAESALKLPEISPLARSSALYHLASSHFDQRRYAQALPHLEELVKIERSEISLMLLGICRQKNGNLPEAERLIKEAIVAAPDRADLHSYLAGIYEEMGKPQEAQIHLQQAKLLQSKIPQPE